MQIRTYQPGDEEIQARIFNTAAARLPAFKPATADEVARRYRSADPDPGSKFYAVVEATGEVVGYALFNPNGRVSYPWCLPGAEEARRPLLDAVLGAMTERGLTEAWATYRADWEPVLGFFREAEFAPVREMVNFVTETTTLPTTPIPPGMALGPLEPEDVPRLRELGGGLFADEHPDRLGAYFWDNPWFAPDSLFGLRKDGVLVGAGLVIVRQGYADPMKLDAAMPCFRLGALGTERERHKRVNGMVSCVFAEEVIGQVLLAEARRRLEAAGLTHAAAQAPSDRADLIAFSDRFFRRQGAFPILARTLAGLAPAPSARSD